MKPIKQFRRYATQTSRWFLGNTARVSVMLMVLAGSALGLDEIEMPERTSPSGKLQFAHFRNNSSVMLFRKSGLSEWAILFPK